MRRNDSTVQRIDSANSLSTFPPSFPNGWMSLTFNAAGQNGLRSLPNSWSRDLDGANFEPGVYELRGCRWWASWRETFENGTLSCGATVCQGNYGGSFAHRVRRTVIRSP